MKLGAKKPWEIIILSKFMNIERSQMEVHPNMNSDLILFINFA